MRLKTRKKRGKSRRKRMSSLAWLMSSLWRRRLMPRRILRSSGKLPFSTSEFSRLVLPPPPLPRPLPVLGLRVAASFILSKRPAYSIRAPKTNSTHTITQASMAVNPSACNSKKTIVSLTWKVVSFHDPIVKTNDGRTLVVLSTR